MTIGENIRKFRKANGFTQETLAEKLGLTPSAVSQWETDRVMPDITQLPVLCKAFGVTSDQLLGIDTQTTEEIIDGIIEKSNGLCREERFREACAFLRSSLEKYPDSYDLMSALAHCIALENYPDYNPSGRTEQIYLYEKIIAGCDNENLINTSVGALCSLYAREGRVEDAKAILKHVPDPVYSHNECLLAALGGTMEWAYEALNQINEYFHKTIGLMSQVGIYVEYAICDEDILKVWDKVEKMIDVFYENGDYQLANTYLLKKHLYIAIRYAKLKRKDDALESLTKMMDLMEILEREHYRERSARNETFVHTSVLSRRVTSDEEPYWTGLYDPEFYYKMLLDERFDSVRDDPVFKSVSERLLGIVKKEQ